MHIRIVDGSAVWSRILDHDESYEPESDKRFDLLSGQTWWRHRTEVATIVIAGSAILSLIVSGLQWTEIEKSRQASERQNQIAVSGNKNAEINQERIARSYLGYDHVDINNDNLYLDGTIFWRNLGQTPAYILFAQSYMIEADNQEDLDKYLVDLNTGTPPYRYQGSVGAGLTFSVNWETDDERDIAGFRKGTVKRYILGKIVYRDVFNKNHVSSYCEVRQIGSDGKEHILGCDSQLSQN